MSELFDPYYTWLGIPPAQQPPNHYRLLGIEAFESNPDVIQRAADRCMADLRTYQTGKHGATSQRLLNEVGAAKICLLNPEKKAAYDDSLREKSAAGRSEAVEADVFTSLAEAAADGRFGVGQRPRRPRRNVALVASTAAVVTIVFITAWMFLSGIFLSDKELSDDSHRVALTDAAHSDPKKAENSSAVGHAASLPAVEDAPKKADGAVRGSPDPAQGLAEGLQSTPGTSGQATGGVGRPAPSASTPPQPPVAAGPPPGKNPSPNPTDAVKKHPIPSAEIQREIGATLEETYRISQGKTSEAKIQLAKELSVAAGKSAKPEEQYVLLRKAIDLACDGGDAALMLETLGSLIDAFTIDPLLAKATMLERFAKGPRTPARVQSLVEVSRAVIDDAMAEDRYEIASGLAKTVSDASSRASPQLRKDTADRRKRVQQSQKQFEEVQKALAALKDNSEDADANLTVGSWNCFIKDDWKTGLPHLAKGNDVALKSLAERELNTPPATPEERLKLADAWWDAAAERRGEQQAAMLRAAGHWYEQAIGQLQGINKTKAEKRLSQIAEFAQDTPSRPGREPPPAIAPFDAKRARGYQLQWARYLKVPVEFTNSTGMKFVLIPPGEFDMGSTDKEVEQLCKEAKKRGYPESLTGRFRDESPQHRVRITNAFYMGLCEVTQSQYAQVMGINPSKFKASGPDAPVEQVSWDDAVAFCRRLSGPRVDKIAPGEYRLPTEAEWEYAARAGTTTAYFSGDDPAAVSAYASYGSNSGGRSHPVAQKKPNPFGLYDVLGNVWEWCADAFSAQYYREGAAADPPGPAAGNERVMRGGSWTPDTVDLSVRCAFRSHGQPSYCPSNGGCRVVRTLPRHASSGKESQRPPRTENARTDADFRGSAPSLAVVPLSAEQARQYQEQWAKHLKVPIEQTNSIGMKVVLIPPGEFDMGSNQDEVYQLLREAKENNYPEWYKQAVPMQTPRHRVRLTKPFYLGAFEVTVGAFRRFVDATGYKTDAEKDGKGGFGGDEKGWGQKPEFVWRTPGFTQTDTHPVVHVSWNDAAAFCQWLGRADGQEYRLPTDAEWECACRAGSAARLSFGDDVARLGDYAWYLGNSGQELHPVGERQPNALGLHDMHGSVREWCADWFAPDYFAKSPKNDPLGPDSGTWRVTRGNVWNDIAAFFRCAYRTANGPPYRDVNIGFRVARSLPARTD